MFFSVIMPVYNGEKYLKECVDSYLNQTETDFEIVLCNDCSTDDSLKICNEYKQQYPDKVRVLQNEKNMGVVLTKRRLFESALGEWILCSDCDDKIELNALEKLKKIINNNDVDMVIFNAKCIHLDGRVENFVPSLIPNKLYRGKEKTEVYNAIYSNNYLNSLATKVFRKDVLDRGADYQEGRILKSGEDIYQSYPLFDRAKSIYYLNDALYIYMKREGSITGSFHKDFYYMRLVLWKRDDYYRNKWNLGEEISQNVYYKRNHEIINYLSKLLDYSDKNEWIESVEKINNDGVLKDIYEESNEKGRYKLYCLLILEKHYFLIRLCLHFENILKKLIYGKRIINNNSFNKK